MAISTVAISAGVGTSITVDTTGSGDVQVVKLAEGTVGSSTPITGSASAGLNVNVTAVAGTVAVINNGAAKLAVDGSGVTQPVSGSVTAVAVNTAPVAVRISSGSAWIDTLPVSIASAVNVAGTVSISGSVAATQSGTWNIGTVATITNPVTVTGTVALSGTSPVSGTVTSNQGTAAAAAGGWPVKLTDGTNSVTLVAVGGVQTIPVKVLSTTGGGVSVQDKTAFTEGTTFVNPLGGVYNDAFAGSPAAGQASVVRITAFRGAHVNLRTAAGAEIGTAASPVYIASSAASVAVAVKDSSGNPITQTNPLQVQPAPSSGAWKSHVAYTASQTGIVLRTPTAGKISYIEGFIIQPTAAGSVTIFDATDTATTRLFSGSLPAGLTPIVVTPARPIPLAAINNVLKYTTGGGATGDISVFGFEA